MPTFPPKNYIDSVPFPTNISMEPLEWYTLHIQRGMVPRESELEIHLTITHPSSLRSKYYRQVPRTVFKDSGLWQNMGHRMAASEQTLEPDGHPPADQRSNGAPGNSGTTSPQSDWSKCTQTARCRQEHYSRGRDRFWTNPIWHQALRDVLWCVSSAVWICRRAQCFAPVKETSSVKVTNKKKPFLTWSLSAS